MMMKNKILRITCLCALAAMLIIVVAGCTSTGPQGWSGCTSGTTNVYYGSLDSRMISINPTSRDSNLPFPNRENGEWYSNIRMSAAGGGLCGPMLCAPSSTGVVLYSAPAVIKDLAYIATYSGKLYAFNAQTGSDRWVYPRESSDSIGAVVGNMILVNNNIYLASSNGSIYAFNQDFGDKLWEYKTADRIWTTPAYNNDNIFAGSYDGNLYAVAAKNGNEVWKVKLPASMASSPVIYKDSVIFGSFDRYLYAFNQKDGSQKWRFSGGNWFWADPVVKDNIVIAPCLDNFIYAVNGDTGEKLWELEVGKVAAKPAISGDVLAVVTEPGDLYLIETGKGSIKQKINIGYKTVAPLLAFNNMIYAHAMDDYIYAINIDTGKLAWRFKAEIK